MKRKRGFTLVELVLVIVLAGILFIAVAPRFNLATYNLNTAAGELVAAIRYAQEMAMSHSGACPYVAQITTTGGEVYTSTPASGCGTKQAIADPSSGASPYQLPPSASAAAWSGITLSPTGTISFDSRGQPTCAGGLACATANAVITLTKGSETRTVTIERVTGFTR